jgi:polyphosphate kinase 2 (PPK2 family)
MTKTPDKTMMDAPSKSVRKRKANSGNGAGTMQKKSAKKNGISNKQYEKELFKLQLELVKLQEWIKDKGLKVVIVFEGRDAAPNGTFNAM